MIKQTQTKYFDFSDVGLDFCSGSKNKFPEVFKKMLNTGYNPQTVASTSISGNQVTLTFGVNHGYVADRVLLVTATGGFSKEVYIDSVTSNTITFTQAVTTGLSGTITTKVASLGWELVYEVGNIHIYKMKHINDTERYVRFCFETVSENRNAVAICIGKTANLATGIINDPLALQSTASLTSPSAANLPKWDTHRVGSAHNDWTYSQGFSTYGKGCCVGSNYHFSFLSGDGYNANAPHHIFGIFPSVCFNYEALDYPVLIAVAAPTAGSVAGSIYGNFSRNSGACGHASIGNIRVRFDAQTTVSNSLMSGDISSAPATSFLSSELDNFYTTTARPLEIYEASTSQHIGYIYGIYQCMYRQPDQPVINISNSPHITTDIDFDNRIVVAISASNSTNDLNARFIAIPIEEIKIGS